MMRAYMMEAAFLQRLLADRKELLAIARSFRTADEMRKAREDLMASARINLAPKAGEDPSKLYTIDPAGIAHIPMIGELTPSAKTDACGAYTAEALTEYPFLEAAIRAADADPKVTGIALDANTPGGNADGVDMVAQTFAGVSKPTFAYVADSMQSAGYYIGSQADKVIALSPMSKVGSIGVAVELTDDTRKLAAEGIDRHIYTSTDAPNKRPDPSTEEGAAMIVAYADGLQGVFTDRVAQGRNTTAENVRANYGKGGAVFAAEALQRGMIDEIRGMDISRESAGVAGSATVAKADGTLKTGGAKNMTLDELKRDHPDLYAAVYSAGEASGKVKG
ncbi:MAG: S49 family peptidase, partial [Spirochaetes bacterium]|nr:S49 family peptidase [Spirochaetota bacterium]